MASTQSLMQYYEKAMGRSFTNFVKLHFAYEEAVNAPGTLICLKTYNYLKCTLCNKWLTAENHFTSVQHSNASKAPIALRWKVEAAVGKSSDLIVLRLGNR